MYKKTQLYVELFIHNKCITFYLGARSNKNSRN